MFEKINISKKIIILIFVLVLAVGGFFLWRQQWRETPPEQWDTAKVSPREDYIVRETSEGKIVENKKTGLSFRVPSSWVAEEKDSFYTPYIAFYSSDVEIDATNRLLLRKGCKVVISVSYIKTNIDTFEKNLRESWPSSILNKFERIEVNSRTAIKHTFTGDENLNIFGIGIHLPFKNKIYEISLESAIHDKEYCGIEFNKFLETVSID